MDEKVERSQGTVKFFNAEEGWGFCTREGKPDVFLHANALKRSGITDALGQDDVIEFDALPVLGKNPKADNIKIIKRAK